MLDIDKLITDSIAAATDAAQKDVTLIAGFMQTQFQAIADNAAGIVADRLAGKLTDAEVDLLIGRIPKLVQATINTLEGLALITLEKIWNAVATTVQDAIRLALKSTI
jgi:hypothetical protein